MVDILKALKELIGQAEAEDAPETPAPEPKPEPKPKAEKPAPEPAKEEEVEMTYSREQMDASIQAAVKAALEAQAPAPAKPAPEKMSSVAPHNTDAKNPKLEDVAGMPVSKVRQMYRDGTLATLEAEYNARSK